MSDLDIMNAQPIPSDGKHLTDQQAPKLERYLNEIAHHLGVGHWLIQIGRDLPPEGARLMIQPTPNRYQATVLVSETWWKDASPVEKRNDLTHEILHLVHEEQTSVIDRFFQHTGDVAEYVSDIVQREFANATEKMVDALSYRVAQYMPEWLDETDTTDMSSPGHHKPIRAILDRIKRQA